MIIGCYLFFGILILLEDTAYEPKTDGHSLQNSPDKNKIGMLSGRAHQFISYC